LYKVGAVLERLLENKWSKKMMDFAPELKVN
jgi:hypothetical protein